MKKLLLVGSVILLMVGCTANQEEPLSQDTSTGQLEGDNREQGVETGKDHSFIQIIETVLIASELEIPWSIVKDADTFYVTERAGTIAKIQDGRISRERVELAEEVLQVGEGGLLGFVLDPQFKENAKAYLYHTYGSEESVLNRVVEVQYRENKWVETRVLIDQIEGDRFHNGGRIKIGPDAHLYITTGDALIEDLSQEEGSLAGKILRIKLDGSVPEDNPFPDSPVYSLGHRNPQGLAWSEDGILYSSEHGPTAHDEINRIEGGGNYGWPEIIGDETAAGMEAPLFQSGLETWAPSGMVYLDGVLYVAALRGSMVIGFDLQKGESQVIWEGQGRVRDLFLDGENLYAITNNTDGRGVPSVGDDQLIELVWNKE